MKKLYLALLILIPSLLQAQRERVKPQHDSLAIYQRELDSLYRQALDSLRTSEAYMRLMGKVDKFSRKIKGYSGFTLFLDALHSDYGQFNEMLAQEGFPPLEETVLRMGFGMSLKANHLMLDFYYAALGLNSSSKKDDEKITAGLSNYLQFDIGYNLLKSETFSIYPYGGLSLRISKIRYTKKETVNPDYTSITNMLSDGEDIRLSSTRIGYQAGIGFDVPIWRDKKDDSQKILLFIKTGINRPLWKDKYQHGDLPAYNTGIKQGIYNVTLGFKFVGGN